MTLLERLNDDMKTAMRAGDTLKRDVIRLIRAAVKNEEISKGKELDDTSVVEVMGRMTRQHRDSIDAYSEHNRGDLVAKEEAELAVVMQYMPEQLLREQIAELAKQAVHETGAQGPGDRGKVMGRLMPQLRGKADGNMVNAVVAELLESLAN
jgi:uncharacterized protein YqeY